MGSVTGYTAQKMQEIIDDTVSGAHITGDDLILELTGGGTVNAGNVRGPAGPTGGIDDAASDGDFYLRKDGAWKKVTPNTTWVSGPGPATEQVVTSTTGVDWTKNGPTTLDLAFTKLGDATDSWIKVRLAWSGHINTAAWCTTYAGVKVDSGGDVWCAVGHQQNLQSHFEHSDLVALGGLAAGAHSLRARIKVAAGGSEPYRNDVGDFFRIEIEEIYV